MLRQRVEPGEGVGNRKVSMEEATTNGGVETDGFKTGGREAPLPSIRQEGLNEFMWDLSVDVSFSFK